MKSSLNRTKPSNKPHALTGRELDIAGGMKQDHANKKYLFVKNFLEELSDKLLDYGFFRKTFYCLKTGDEV